MNKNLELIQLLSNQYKECDEEGHKKSNIYNRICEYCYRRLEYKIIYKKRLNDLGPKFIDQRVRDLVLGISKLEEELSKAEYSL